jgi:hypothetical protein
MSKGNRAKQITILVIDDKTGFVKDALEPVCRDTTPKIKLEHRTNLADGRKVLEDNVSIVGVILDVKCRLSPNDIDDPGFIGKALDVMKSFYPDMPRVILTGEPGVPVQLKTFHKDEIVFEKREDDIEKMFDHLIKYAADNDYSKVARIYKDIFDLFDKGYFDETTRRDLYETIRTMHHKERIGDNLKRIRPLQEAIYNALYQFNESIIPLKYLDRKYNTESKSDKSERSQIVDHLMANGYIDGKDSIVFKAGELIQRITSHNASHKQLAAPKFPPTIYTVQMCVFAALDLFLWFKGVVEDKSKLCS